MAEPSSAQLQAEIQKYQQKHDENPEGRYFVPLANAYRKQGDVERAERLLRDGLKRHPDYLSAHIVLGRTLADGGASAEATAEFRYVLGVDPQNLIALRSLGELAAASGDEGEAGHWYRELLAVDPMNDEARQALAELEGPAQEDGEPGSFEAAAPWWEAPPGAESAVPLGGAVEGETDSSSVPDREEASQLEDFQDELRQDRHEDDAEAATADSFGLIDWGTEDLTAAEPSEEHEAESVMPDHIEPDAAPASQASDMEPVDSFARTEGLQGLDLPAEEAVIEGLEVSGSAALAGDVDPDGEDGAPDGDRAEDEFSLEDWRVGSSVAEDLELADEGEAEEDEPAAAAPAEAGVPEAIANEAEPEPPSLMLPEHEADEPIPYEPDFSGRFEPALESVDEEAELTVPFDGAAELDRDLSVDDHLVTETMAELYASQGFRNEAIEVYRELLRRRGDDPVLLRRIADLEQSEESELETVSSEHSGGQTEHFDATTDVGGPEQLVSAEASSTREAVSFEPADEAAGFAGSIADTEAEDTFADSFAAGFAGLEPYSGLNGNGDGIASEIDSADPDEGSAPSDLDLEPTDPGELVFIPGADASDFAVDEDAILAPAAEDAQPDRSVSDYFAGLLAWRPVRGVSRPAAAPDGEPEESRRAFTAPTSSAVETGSEAGVEGDSSDRPGEPEATGSPGADEDDDDLFPWELPADDASSAAAAAPVESPAAQEQRATEEVQFRQEAEAAAEPDSPASEPSSPAPSRPSAQSTVEEDDDDLESFQAWLRSLKR